MLEEEEVGENEESQNAVEPEEDDPWARSSQSRDTHQGWQSSSGAWDQWWGYDAWSQTAWHSDDADWRTEAPEILPDMIQGWYLLGDSGLDTGERNMILAAIKQDFSFDRVAQELRNQWPDDDLRRRDQNNRQSGWWMDEADSGEDDNAFIAMDDLNEEGQALVVAAQEEVDRALLAMQNGRRTLREAREKQHQVRMSRKYYKTTFRSGPKGSGKGHDHKGTGTCLRCGVAITGQPIVQRQPRQPPQHLRSTLLLLCVSPRTTFQSLPRATWLRMPPPAVYTQQHLPQRKMW